MSIRMIFSVLTIASLGAIAPWALAAGDAASAPMQATAPAAKGASFAVKFKADRVDGAIKVTELVAR